MKISCNWLRDYTGVDLNPNELADILTMSGLEVEGVETFEIVKGGLNGLVVGEVLSAEKHPDADRLRVTKVNVGGSEPLNIVCGAPNVAAGQKVVVAMVGTKLFPASGEPFEIRKSKIRGVPSEGMICAEDEIGLSGNHDGIMVLPENLTPGMPASEYFKPYSDAIIDVNITANRGDAMSHVGVARDVVGWLRVHRNLDVSLNIPQSDVSTKAPLPIEVKIENTDGCSRYSG
ncbi:MAG TPA: phenylalanine--tRNA ligase subunit beta, partial [Chitinophagales bacterium]|nr:phenylalanine--tRNA ligase subunit beta [Chitinophagales bacterium]